MIQMNQAQNKSSIQIQIVPKKVLKQNFLVNPARQIPEP
jgi:hypothetical protein